MMRSAFSVFICGVILFLSATLGARAQQAIEPPLITVSGQAEVRAAPDEVAFTLEVENIDKDLLAAKSKNDATVKQVLALANKYSIEPQNIQTDYISVEPRYTEVSEERRIPVKKEFIGYAVSKTILIRLKTISRFESLFSDLLMVGVNTVRNVEFRTTEIRKYKDEARAMAIKAAREKALALTREVGQTIGKAYSIREVQDNGYLPANASSNATSIVGGDFSENEATIVPGMITVRARVLVSFRLE